MKNNAQRKPLAVVVQKMPDSQEVPAVMLNPKYNVWVSVNLPVGTGSGAVTYKQLAATLENQVKTRLSQTDLSTGSATVFTNVALLRASLYGPEYSPAAFSTGAGGSPRVIAVALTVGTTTAMKPKSTQEDRRAGTSDRAVAHAKGNETTWKQTTSTDPALVWTAALENSAGTGIGSPLLLRAQVQVW